MTSNGAPAFGVGLTITHWALLVAAVFAWPVAPLAESVLPDLQTQVYELSVKHDFSVRGLDKLGDDPGKRAGGGAREQVYVLLSAFNYVLLTDASGDIDRLLITSRIRPEGPNQQGVYVKTTRRGSHHRIRATLVGPAGNPQSLMLLVDTGATMIVLPRTMSKTLGFSHDDLRDGWSQTANGKVRTKQGILRSVQVGQIVVKDVAVSFVDDDALSDNPLLGMSFLSRFRVTIDDKNERLILIDR
jgi:aspartyl protease family protein